MELTKKEKNDLIIVTIFAGIFTLLGLISLSWGVYNYINLSTFLKHCKRTEGHIIEFVRLDRSRSSDKSFILPKVRYTAPNKTKHDFVAGVSIFDNYKIGSKVTVLYTPNKFDEAKIDSFADLYFLPALLSIIGFFFIFIPWFTIYRHLQTLKK